MFRRTLKTLVVEGPALIALPLIAISLLALFPVGVKATDLHYLVVVDSAEPYQIQPHQRVRGAGIHSSGVISDLLRDIFEGTNIELQEVYLPLRRMVQYVSSDNAPDWISYGSDNWSRGAARNNTDFLQPSLFEQSHSLVSVRGRDFQADNYDDLTGRFLVLIQGYRYGFLDQLIRNHGVKSHRANSHANAIKMLAAGRGDFYLAHDMKARWTISKLGMDLQDFRFHPFTKVGENAQVNITVKRGLSPAIKRHIETRLVDMKSSGRLDEIIARY